MKEISFERTRGAALVAVFAALAACDSSGGSSEMEWARSALERNDGLEIVGVDEQARTFTVRERASGELKIVGVDQIAAAPSDAAGASAAAPAQTTAQAETSPPAAATPSTAQPDEAAQPVDENDPSARVGYEVLEPQVAMDHGSGRVIASGPGYSIQSAGGGTAPAARASTTAAASPATAERRYEPLICQGARLLQIDGRTITFEGDGVKAEAGCEIHITNSHIRASGVGIAARGANVHIQNSTVSGESGAIQASDNAQIYARSSRFSGMVRRFDNAEVHDGGDNVWN
jgi:hypothetical protein